MVLCCHRKRDEEGFHSCRYVRLSGQHAHCHLGRGSGRDRFLWSALMSSRQHPSPLLYAGRKRLWATKYPLRPGHKPFWRLQVIMLQLFRLDFSLRINVMKLCFILSVICLLKMSSLSSWHVTKQVKNNLPVPASKMLWTSGESIVKTSACVNAQE